MSKELKKARNCSFNQYVNSLLHRDTQLLTSHVDKIKKFNAFDLVK